MIKKLLVLILIVGFSQLHFAKPAFAVDGPSIRSCFQSGNNEFVLFMQTLLWSDGFYDGMIEPWNDVIHRNSCQAYDLLGLIKQQQSLRQAIRRAYLNCQNDKVEQYRTAYIKTNAELYYVRNVVNLDVIDGLTTEDLIANPQQAVTSETALYNQMIVKYVDNGLMSRDDFNSFFASLKIRYADRIGQYVVCTEGSWQNVKEKWDEFKDFFTEGKAFKDAAKRIKNRAAALTETAKGFNEEWAKSLIQTTINGLSPADFGEDFSNEFNKNNPFSQDILRGFSAENYYQSVSNFNIKFDIELYRSQLEARFRLLYQNVGDKNSKAMMSELEALNAIILNTFKPLNNVETCTERINGRECS